MDKIEAPLKNIGEKLEGAIIAGKVAYELLKYAEHEVKDRDEVRRKGIQFMKDLLRLADDAACRYKMSHDEIAREIWQRETGGKRWKAVVTEK